MSDASTHGFDDAFAALSVGLFEQNLDCVRQWALEVDWQARLASLKTPSSSYSSVVLSFIRQPVPEGEDYKAWLDFSYQALDCLVQAGFPMLHDDYCLEVMEINPDLAPILARVAHRHGVRDANGRTVLQLLLSYGPPQSDLVEKVLDTRVDLEWICPRGNNALHTFLGNEVFCSFGMDNLASWQECLLMLVEYGVDPLHRNARGNTVKQELHEVLTDSSSPFQAHAGFMERMFDEAVAQAQAVHLEKVAPIASFPGSRRAL